MSGALPFVLGLMLLFPSVLARADDSGDAQRHYEAGTAHYRVGEFAEAIDEFKAAYSISPSTPALFNLAQCYRQLGAARRALFFYRSFVAAAPPSQARDDARVIIEELGAQLTAPPKAEHPQPVALAPSPSPSPEPQLVVASPPHQMSRNSAIALVASTAGSGLALVAAGAGLSAYAHETGDDLASPAHGSAWTRADALRYASGHEAAQAATALYVVGASAIAASVVSALVCRRSLAGEQSKQARHSSRMTASAGGAQWTF